MNFAGRFVVLGAACGEYFPAFIRRKMRQKRSKISENAGSKPEPKIDRDFVVLFGDSKDQVSQIG
jgi:hypothetical protein